MLWFVDELFLQFSSVILNSGGINKGNANSMEYELE